MITGELKNKIDSLWDIFCSGRSCEPAGCHRADHLFNVYSRLGRFRQPARQGSRHAGLPYQSIFADEVQLGERTIDGQQLKWSVFHDFPAQKMYATMQEWVFPFIKNLHGDKNSAYPNIWTTPFSSCPRRCCSPRWWMRWTKFTA